MRKNLGFAFSEVMIGTAFATVLVVAGYPSHLDQVLKSRRAEAQALLVAIPAFSIVATAKGPQKHDKCSFLGMNQAGVRLPFGCW